MRFPRTHQLLLAGSLGLFCPVIASAQEAEADSTQKRSRTEKSLDEITIKHRRKSTEIGMMDPIKTEKIGQRELLKAACCNLSESFETTPSVDVAFTDAVSGYKQVQMLGLTGPYTLITRENIPDTRGMASTTGLTFTPGTWIEGMQLSKGTGSVVNGYESVAGQINVEWLKPFGDETPKWLFNLYQNTQGRTEGNVVFSKKLNEQTSTNLFVHGKGQWLKVDQNNDGFMDQPLDKQWVLANRWFHFSKSGLELQGGIKGVYSDQLGGQKSFSRNTEQVAGNPWGYRQELKRIEAWAKIGKVFRDKPWKSMGLQLSGVYHDQGSTFGARTYDGRHRSFYANYIYQSIIGNTNHIIKAGASNLVDDYNEHFAATGYRRTEVVPGVFAEYAYNYLTKLNIVAGLRVDHHNLFGAFVTPRLHVRYAPLPKTVFRASVGRAQRTANILAENTGYMASSRLFLVSGMNSDYPYGLKPEVAWNTGLNLTQKFRLNYRDGAFSVDYYYTHFESQVVVDVESPQSVRFYNLDGASFAHSFQAQLDYEPVRKFDVRLAYRWYDVQTDYAEGRKQRPLMSAHRAFLNLAYETKNNWKLDYTIQWIGEKRVPALHYEHGGVHHHLQSEMSPSYFMMNAQLSKTWNDNLEVYAGGENLANFMQHNPVLSADQPFGNNFDASMIWGPVMGRNIYGGLRYRIR